MQQLRRPLRTVLTIYLACYLLRVVEYFLLRTDQTFWGEAFLHKLAGIALLCFAARRLRIGPEALGFAGRGVLRHLLMGLGFGLGVFAIAYGAECWLVAARGGDPVLRLYVTSYAVDRNAGMQTGAVFFLLCIAGNLLNVLMEEGVFRGLFQRLLEQKDAFLRSALTASLLFGLWHMVGPVRNYVDGLSSLGGAAANLVMLVVTSGLVGFKYALVTRLTGSLYLAMGDHFVNNTIVNLLHVVSATGADEWMFLRVTIAQTLSFLIVLAVWLGRGRPRPLGASAT